MYCKHCGKPNADDATFCTFCGKSLKEQPPYNGPVNMWGEPIDDLTREFHPVESPEQPEDFSATRVAPAITDLSSTDPYKAESDDMPEPEEQENDSRKTNRKLIIGIVVAAGVLVLVSLIALILHIVMPDGDSDATPASDFEYVLVDDHVELQSYIGKDKTVVIPSRIEKKSVTTILERAFAKRNLVSVTIPDSVTTIADDAFDENPDLVIYGGKNSRAQLFAEKKGLTFAVTGSTPSRTSTLTSVTTTTSKLAEGVTPPTTTTTTETTTTTTTRSETTTSAEPTYAKTTAPPPATDPNASAASLLGNTFAQIKTRLGSTYTVKEGGLNFPHHSYVEFSDFFGDKPLDSSTVFGVTITEGLITERAQIGDTMNQLQAMLTPTTEWHMEQNGSVGETANFHMAYNGKVIEVTLYFSGEGESARCIQAYVGELYSLTDEDRALLG